MWGMTWQALSVRPYLGPGAAHGDPVLIARRLLLHHAVGAHRARAGGHGVGGTVELHCEYYPVARARRLAPFPVQFNSCGSTRKLERLRDKYKISGDSLSA